jgi:carboxylesterase
VAGTAGPAVFAKVLYDRRDPPKLNSFMSIKFAFRTPAGGTQQMPNQGVLMPGRNGQAVVLVHGLTGSPNEMRFLAWFLNTHGYTVSCPRLANHGQPLHILRSTHWEEFYASVRQAFVDLRSGHDRVFAGGLSMGALLALLLADEFQSRVAGVSCLSPTLFYDGWNVPWYHFLLPLGARTPLKNYVYFKEQPPYGLKNERMREKVHQFYEHADIHKMGDVDRLGYPFFPVRLLGELHRLVRHLEGRLPFVHCPCQIIQARHDDMSSVRNAQFIYDRVGSQRKEIIYLEDSYHVITADQERGKVAQGMMDFFAQGAVHA